MFSIIFFLFKNRDSKKRVDFSVYDLSLGSGLGGLLGLLSLLGLLGGLSSDGDTSDTTAREGDVLEEGTEVSVVADGESEGAGSDALGALGDGLGSEFEGLSSQVLESGSEEDSGARGDTLGVAALAEEATDAASGEGEAGLVATGLLGSDLLDGLLGSSHFMSFVVERFFWA
jgi:hypothetical protein